MRKNAHAARATQTNSPSASSISRRAGQRTKAPPIREMKAKILQRCLLGAAEV
jgi:hypothetical protein